MVEPTPHHDGLDPIRLQMRAELESALAQNELAVLETEGGTITPAVEAAAYRLAVARGQCNLFGVGLAEDLERPLPAATATAAARGLVRAVEHAIAEANTLGPRWDAAPDQPAAEALVCDLLQRRMDAHAASEAIDEADEAALEGEASGRAELLPAIDAMLDVLDQFDQALEAEIGLLSTVVDTNLLHHWRAMLVEKDQALLPWWLDGTLEAEAERSYQEALAWGPDETAWAILRRRHASERPPILSWRPRLAPSRLMAAAEDQAPDQPYCMPLFWRSPDDRFEARLVFPPRDEVPAEEPLMIAFLRVEDLDDAVVLAGRTARLGDLSLTLDAQGVARFTAGQLPETNEPPPLRLDPDATPWTRREL